ncbi:MAG: RrF2 family transcriptional regulator [Christensenellales bacterium]
MNGEFCVAVHALVYLNHRGDTVSSEALAENICTHAARVRRVMAKLKRAGLIATKEGAEGGYQFIGDPEAVSLAHIADALDVQCVSLTWHSGDTDLPCLVASGMAGIMDEVCGQLNGRCREYLSCVTIAAIDRRIFTAPGGERG